MKAPAADKNATFIETPGGVFTASGHWFHTNEETLKGYAGPVLERVPFQRLLEIAEIWLRSPATIVLWGTPALLWKLGVWPTLGIGLVLYFVLSLWTPVLINMTITPVLKVMDNVLAQALLYIVVMSWFAMNEQFWLMGAGLAVFILMRWGIVAKLFGQWLEKVRTRMYAVPFADQVLKSVIVRSAMKHRVSLPELDKIERFILNQIHKK